MLDYRQRSESAILACSALKQQYRELMAGGFGKNETRFVYLHAPGPLIKERMRTRRHRYMNPDLLDSQLVTLEVPCDAWSVTVAGTPQEAGGEVHARLQKAGRLTTGVEK